ncbi:50S ribosomal protein L11 methyltransferase [Luteibaculum oceani]|uniref:Ribosomal protein L11 methyltransferase n=1 Tax=Luteibaculum oceani TaxID=1294296 RepID=A0A5C6UUH8_9FLAO|nr:50S ribosomal protein L11 methyltransferase [Luteibaculum oceani]TXC76977.1 50S ribosomal protein L11 methyltransferase [Luteibaculum oceani]
MEYTSWNISISPLEQKELLYPILAELGFDSFEETSEGLKAFIPTDDYKNDLVEEVKSHAWLASSKVEITVEQHEHQNWNEVWESNFQPIQIEDRLLIRAPFHPENTRVKMDLLIAPQMSFGTGHHETTYLMCNMLLDYPVTDKSVLDMGSGTGILAILCEKLGAKKTLGIEIEEMAVQNAMDNAALNNCSKTAFLHGDANGIPQEKYELILANINRNILLQDMDKYAAALKQGGDLFLSGFYNSDVEILVTKANELGLTRINKTLKNDWCLLQLQK